MTAGGAGSGPSIAVAQLGSREHYGVAKGLARRGLLSCLITDAWVHPNDVIGRAVELLPTPRIARAFLQRFDDELSAAPVPIVSQNVTAVARTLGWTLRDKLMGPDPYGRYVVEGKAFARFVTEELRAMGPSAGSEWFFGYSTASLEVLSALKGSTRTIVDQIDPGPYEYELVAEERRRWGGWEDDLEVPDAYVERLRAEWDVADFVVVNSEWSREALIRDGVSSDKVVTVPLGLAVDDFVQAPGGPRPPAAPSGRGLDVLWLGTVSLRKGIPYALEAMRMLADHDVHLHVVGPATVSQQRLGELSSPNVTFHGAASGRDVKRFLSASQVLLLPTISDGFALVQLEALAYGLPIVVTPNCARVVRDGVEGFVVEPRSAEQIARALARLVEDRELLDQMSVRARDRAREFTLDASIDVLLENLDLAEKK